MAGCSLQVARWKLLKPSRPPEGYLQLFSGLEDVTLVSEQLLQDLDKLLGKNPQVFGGFGGFGVQPSTFTRRCPDETWRSLPRFPSQQV